MTKTGKELVAHVIKVTESKYEGAVGYISKYIPEKKSETGKAYYEAYVTRGTQLLWLGLYPDEFEVKSTSPLPWVSR